MGRWGPVRGGVSMSLQGFIFKFLSLPSPRTMLVSGAKVMCAMT